MLASTYVFARPLFILLSRPERLQRDLLGWTRVPCFILAGKAETAPIPAVWDPMRTEVKTIRCKIDRSLPFDKLRERLDEQLEMNHADGTIRLTPDHDGTILLAYRNRDEADAKHVFQMVCNTVDIHEAQAHGRWTAQYPPVKIEWLAAIKPRPEGVCTDCGSYTFAIGAINQRCGNVVGKKRCNGVYRSNMNWRTCPSCNGTGKPAADDTEAIRNNTGKCSSCQGAGWQAVRRTQR